MVRAIIGVAGGLVAWIVAATIGNLVLRAAWPGYSQVEPSMNFTLGMMIARLLVAAVASLFAGLSAAWITRRRGRAVTGLAVLLPILFIPVHYSLWQSFPVWYHLVFFASLLVLTLLGALAFPRGIDRAGAPG
jgi:hypothetical protein